MAGPRKSDKTKFAKRLIELREQQGWSRQELATRMNVTLATVYNWENEKCFPKVGAPRTQLYEIFATSAKDLHLPPYDRDEED